MIYLNTGANGSGKTLNALKFICEVLNPEGDRPVFYYSPGRQSLTPTDVENNPLRDWQEITAEQVHNWQEFPEGSIFFIDEFRHIWPFRVAKDRVPSDVDALSEHRSKGFDFVLTAQKPSAQFDPYIQGFIDSHIHMFTTNSKNASKHIVIPAFCSSPFNPPKLLEGDVTSKVVRFDQKYYKYYKSASVHTKVNKLPVKRLLFIGVLPLLLGFFLYLGYSALSGLGGGIAGNLDESVVFRDKKGPSHSSSVAVSSRYIDRFVPRVDGLAYTAPFYDSVVSPKTAPFPSACVAGRQKGGAYVCQCYTSQATRLDVPQSLCESIAENGWFDFTLDSKNKDNSSNRLDT